MTSRLVGRLLTVMVRAGLRAKVVPPEHLKETSPHLVVVSCPCGEKPVVPAGAYPKHCKCQRWFYYDGTDVFALNGPE